MNDAKPDCFGQYTGGQDAAEKECYSCHQLANCCTSSRNVLKRPEHSATSLEYRKMVPKDAGTILDEMASTFRERNAVYGDNYKRVGKIMAVLFPEGAPPEVLHSDQFHLFELIVVKLSRYAISGLQHIDSIHDAGVYAAMCESINLEGEAS